MKIKDLETHFRILTTLLIQGCGALPTGDLAYIDGVAPGTLRIFVTSQPIPMVGETAFEAHCTVRARAAGLKRTYRPLLSTPSLPVSSRFPMDWPIYTVSAGGTFMRVANHLAAMFQSGATQLLQAPKYDEFGGQVSASPLVWTGTNALGNPNGHCGSWTSSSALNPILGIPTAVDHTWTASTTVDCSGSARLYCVSIQNDFH